MLFRSYQKFSEKLSEQKLLILKSLETTQSGSSNLNEMFAKVINLSSKLTATWDSSDVNAKEKLQKLVFPEGIIYNCKKRVFRTEKVNEVFHRIALLNNVSGQNETGQNNTKIDLSCYVGMARFELATSWSQTRRDNRATLHPELLVIFFNSILLRRGWDSIRRGGTA